MDVSANCIFDTGASGNSTTGLDERGPCHKRVHQIMAKANKELINIVSFLVKYQWFYCFYSEHHYDTELIKVKSMHRSGTEAIRNTKRTYGQLFTKRWTLSNRNGTKNI